jgi:8-oxo-dGTP pyrophosphatase MutT (NUDIX family)
LSDNVIAGKPGFPDGPSCNFHRSRAARLRSASRRDSRLLVNPVYKETWDLPDGVVEAEESPHAACRREVAEELGLDRPPDRVLAVDQANQSYF